VIEQRQQIFFINRSQSQKFNAGKEENQQGRHG